MKPTGIGNLIVTLAAVEFLPPPVFYVDIGIYRLDMLMRYRENKVTRIADFPRQKNLYPWGQEDCRLAQQWGSRNAHRAWFYHWMEFRSLKRLEAKESGALYAYRSRTCVMTEHGHEALAFLTKHCTLRIGVRPLSHLLYFYVDFFKPLPFLDMTFVVGERDEPRHLVRGPAGGDQAAAPGDGGPDRLVPLPADPQRTA